MCADNPVLVLAIFSWIIAVLAYGIQYLIIITDPAELWAAPTSQIRLEKDYFDSRFGPFYRSNQIFIKPTNTQHVSKSKSLNYSRISRRFFSKPH